MKPAVILLSGGIDSTTTLAIALAEGYDAYPLSFDYGQRHQIETQAARRIADSLGAKEHRVATIDLRVFGGSALTDHIDVPKHRSEKEIGHGIPVTYVPARNTVFLAYALAWAEVISAADIFLGVNAIDYSGYPDCRPEFVDAINYAVGLATGEAVVIEAPFSNMDKNEIAALAVRLNVPIGLTWSCYEGDTDPCRKCGACVERSQALSSVKAVA